MESPVAEMLNVPVAVEAVYAYGELQPAGGLFLQMAIEKANSLDTDAVRAAFSTR